MFCSEKAVPPTPQLLAALSVRQAADAPGGSVLAQLDPKLRADSHPLDVLTIEFVALLFDGLLGDDSLPTTVRAELARLQIIAVKAAMLDRTFFASRRHPMRRLLDGMSTLGADVEIDSAEGSEFAVGLRIIVGDLIAAFETDLSVFAASMRALDALAEQCRAPMLADVEAAASNAETAERLEVIRMTCVAEVKRRIRPRAAPFVVEFLKQWWVQALVASHSRAAPREDSWTHRLEVVDALMWSVSTLGSTDVKKLALTLPTIMRDIRRGMDEANMPLSEREQFFAKLMALHTHTIARAKARAVATIETSAGEPDAIAANDPIADEPPIDAATLQLLDDLPRGTIVDLKTGGHVRRVKLAWVSPSRKTFVFSSQATRTHIVPSIELADAFKQGRARIVTPRESLLDRLVGKIARG